MVLYNFVQWNITSIESIDIDIPRMIPCGKPRLLPKSNRLYTYLDKSVDFYFLPFWKSRPKLERLLIGRLFAWHNRWFHKQYAKAIVGEGADCINLLVYSRHDLALANAIREQGFPICITYHEVLQELVGKEILRPPVEETLKFGTPIIVHSQNTANKLVAATQDRSSKSRIHVISFGAFESYLSYGEGEKPEGLPKDYLLYLGHVHPYKGLKFLYEAVELIDDKLGNVKIVVAGGGYDPVINKMKENPRFMVYNHFISNAELVGLIRNCLSVICPYIAASQSGLVQTAMVWSKPVIATKVGAFTEVIRDGENGLLCDPSSSQSLADMIERFLTSDHHFCKYLVPDSLEWNGIADKYIQLFESLKHPVG